MKQYLELMQKCWMKRHTENEHRTVGTGTLPIFYHQMRFNLQEGFFLFW